MCRLYERGATEKTFSPYHREYIIGKQLNFCPLIGHDGKNILLTIFAAINYVYIFLYSLVL